MVISFADLIGRYRESVETHTVQEAASRISSGGDLLVLDVREEAEFASGSVPNAVNIPRGFLEFRIAEHCDAADHPILVHCKSGGRAVLAARTLAEMGYTNVAIVFGDVDELVDSLT